MDAGWVVNTAAYISAPVRWGRATRQLCLSVRVSWGGYCATVPLQDIENIFSYARNRYQRGGVPTGGYLWGFIIMTFFCGLAADFGNNAKGCIAKILISILALAGCHIPGIIQLKIVAGMSWPQAALLGTVPYLLKDILSMVAAYFIAAAVRKALRSADILDWQKKTAA